MLMLRCRCCRFAAATLFSPFMPTPYYYFDIAVDFDATMLRLPITLFHAGAACHAMPLMLPLYAMRHDMPLMFRAPCAYAAMPYMPRCRRHADAVIRFAAADAMLLLMAAAALQRMLTRAHAI